MLDKFLAGAVEAYLPKLAKMREERAAELGRIKAKVRTNPEEVEAWFDAEIDKLSSINSMLKDATAGI
ncbi:MAG: hypothetical protein ABI347_07735 [Nitrososphaera sp.]